MPRTLEPSCERDQGRCCCAKQAWERGKATETGARDGCHPSVLGNSYVWDKLGRITQKTETIQGTTTTFDYGYDLAGRLEEVRTNGAVSAVYAYDANGNRLSRTTPGGSESAVYDAHDRLTSYGDVTYAYTANGELLSKTDTVTGETTSYAYDTLGNLVSVWLPDGRSIEYVNDGMNRRVGKKVNGVLVQAWLYGDPLNPVAELDGSGNVLARFVYGSRPNVPDTLVKGGVTYRILSDHLGSPRLVVDAATGALAQRIDYDAWGNVTLDTNPGFQPSGFAGGLYDADTGLVRFGARDYDAEVGRWTAKDPIRFDGQDGPNLYGYGLNDPVNLLDESGEGVKGAAVCIAIAAVTTAGTVSNIKKCEDRLAEIDKQLEELEQDCELSEADKLERKLELEREKAFAAGELAAAEFKGNLIGLAVGAACVALVAGPF